MINIIINYKNKDYTIQKRINYIKDDLNNQNRDNIMMKYFTSDNPKIKSNAMEIILNVKLEQIEEEELSSLIKSLQRSNFLELGKIDTLANSFIFILNKIEYQFDEKNSNFKLNEDVIKIAFSEAIKNFESFNPQKKLEKNKLGLSLSFFLINITKDKSFKDFISKENENFHNDFLKIIQGEINF